MASSVVAPEGYEAIPGRSHEKAVALLAAARSIGVDPTLVRVIAGRDEYHVPKEVAEEYLKDPVAPEDEGPKPSAEPWAPNGDIVAGQVQAAKDGDGSENPPTGEDAQVKKPSKTASKGEWVEYARTKGYDPEEGLTTKELIEKYGSDD